MTADLSCELKPCFVVLRYSFLKQGALRMPHLDRHAQPSAWLLGATAGGFFSVIHYVFNSILLIISLGDKPETHKNSSQSRLRRPQHAGAQPLVRCVGGFAVVPQGVYMHQGHGKRQLAHGQVASCVGHADKMARQHGEQF